jgi:hypothetical protein
VTAQVGNWGDGSRRWNVRFRVTWTLLSVFLVECLVFGLAMLPGALFWELFARWTYPFVLVRIVVLSMVGCGGSQPPLAATVATGSLSRRNRENVNNTAILAVHA